MNAPVKALDATQSSRHSSSAQEPELVAERLARFVSGLTPERIPAAVSRQAKHLILDALGIAIASTGFDFAHRTLTAISGLAGAGDVPVIGFPASLPMRDAALVNGVLIHGLDYDDTHTGGVIHATASVLPTVLAVGARQHSSGAEILTAYIAGVETAARLGAVAKGGFHQIGFHPTGLVGAFACALVAGRLMGLTEAQLVMAQGITLSAASGSLEFLEDGAWTKRFHPGWAANAGITAAALAQQGFVGPKRAYEGRFGLYASHLQARHDPNDLALATADLGEVWELLQVAVKPFPACHFTHAFADAAIALRSEKGFDPGGIERIVALVPQEIVKTVCEPVVNKRRPANSYDAQFSIPYIVAAAILRGRFGLAELEQDAMGDPEISALADKVEYEVDPGSGFPKYYSGEIVIHLADGRTSRHREHMNRGCGDRPLSEADILRKYQDNAARAVAPARAAALREAVLGLDALSDVAALGPVLGRG